MKLDSDYNEPDMNGEPIRDLIQDLLMPTQSGLAAAPNRKRQPCQAIVDRVELMRVRYESGQDLWTGRRLGREDVA